MKPVQGRPDMRHVSIQESAQLRPGDTHYRAYVGPPAQWDFMASTQLRLLTALGLKETDRVLDLGCGALRAGRLLMMYLRAGGYFGIEPNQWLIDDAIDQEIGREFIALKARSFSNTSDFDTTCFGTQFDMIVAQSIFSHAGPDLVAEALASCATTLSADGLMLATFIHANPAVKMDHETHGWTYPACISYAPERIQTLAAEANLAIRELPWFHPRQSWYALAHTQAALPQDDHDRHLTGAVLRDARFVASLG